MAVNKRRVDAKPQPRQKPGKHPWLRFPAHYSRQNATKEERRKRVLGQKALREAWRGRRHAQKGAESGGIIRECSCARGKEWLERQRVGWKDIKVGWKDKWVVGRQELVGRSVERKSGSRSSGREGSAFANDNGVWKSSSHHRDGEEDETCGCSWSCGNRRGGHVRGRARADETRATPAASRLQRNKGSRDSLTFYFLSWFIWGVCVSV